MATHVAGALSRREADTRLREAHARIHRRNEKLTRTLDELLERLGELHDPDRPVRIISVGIGTQADMSALEQIAEAACRWLRDIAARKAAASQGLPTKANRRPSACRARTCANGAEGA